MGRVIKQKGSNFTDLWLATLRERRLVDMASRTRGAVAWGHVIAGAAGFAAGLLASQLLECESKQKRGEALPDALKGLKLHICESQYDLMRSHVISCGTDPDLSLSLSLLNEPVSLLEKLEKTLWRPRR